MPYIGLPPFLHCDWDSEKCNWKVCQCPISGFPHFYLSLMNSKVSLSMCQCPISGFPHFYCRFYWVSWRTIVCQCPISGFPHFYWPQKASNAARKLCQCPISGFPHFYKREKEDLKMNRDCVNALYRASPISTLSLQKPFKINGFRGRFQGVIVRKF